jgi:hypothetical protein
VTSATRSKSSKRIAFQLSVGCGNAPHPSCT